MRRIMINSSGNSNNNNNYPCIVKVTLVYLLARIAYVSYGTLSSNYVFKIQIIFPAL